MTSISDQFITTRLMGGSHLSALLHVKRITRSA